MIENTCHCLADAAGDVRIQRRAFRGRQAVRFRKRAMTSREHCFRHATVAGALWVTLTKRRVSPALLVGSWWLLAVIVGLVLAVGVLLLPSMSRHLNPGRDGSGGPGVGLLILIVGLSAIAVSSIIGIGIGVMKARARKWR